MLIFIVLEVVVAAIIVLGWFIAGKGASILFPWQRITLLFYTVLLGLIVYQHLNYADNAQASAFPGIASGKESRHNPASDSLSPENYQPLYNSANQLLKDFDAGMQKRSSNLRIGKISYAGTPARTFKATTNHPPIDLAGYINEETGHVTFIVLNVHNFAARKTTIYGNEATGTLIDLLHPGITMDEVDKAFFAIRVIKRDKKSVEKEAIMKGFSYRFITRGQDYQLRIRKI